jgi:diguanylate cyclase (GGDEF)-like protein
LRINARAEGCHRIALLARANYGTVLVRTARYAEGIEYLGKVMGELAAAGLKGDMGAAKGSIGTAYLELGQYERAIETFREALDSAVVSLECAQLMRQGSRSGDVAARWGGEEFLLILMGADAARAGEIAERLRSAVERFNWAALDRTLAVTLSIGLASSAEAVGSTAALLALADSRVYTAKAGGRNRVVAE